MRRIILALPLLLTACSSGELEVERYALRPAAENMGMATVYGSVRNGTPGVQIARLRFLVTRKGAPSDTVKVMVRDIEPGGSLHFAEVLSYAAGEGEATGARLLSVE